MKSLLENPAHPLWLFLRQALVAAVLCWFLTFNYSNGWAAKDWLTVIGTLSGLGVFDFLKKYLTITSGVTDSLSKEE